MTVAAETMVSVRSQRRDSAGRIVAGIVLLALITLYLFLQVKNFTPGYSEQDIDAYVWLTKRIATLQPLAVRDPSPFQYQGHMWVRTARGLVTTKFAPGNPLLMAPFYLCFGDVGPYYVPPLAGALTLLGAYLLFRRWMGRVASLAAVLTVALNPVFLEYTDYLLTHASDVCLVTWGMLFLFRYLDRPRAGPAIGAGLTLGFAITVRYPDLLLAMPLVATLLIGYFRNRPRPLRPTLFLLAAYSLFPVLLLVYNQILFGNPFRTGYALSNEQGAFSLDLFRYNYAGYVEYAFRVFLFLGLPLGVLGAVLLGPWPQRTVRLLWMVPLFLLYMAYYWYSPRPVSYRFLMALIPVFVGCAYGFIDRVNASRGACWCAVVLLAGVTIAHDWPALRVIGAGRFFMDHRPQVSAANFLAEKLRPDAVVFTEERFANYVGQRRHFELYDLAAFQANYIRHFPPPRSYSLAEAVAGRVPPRLQLSRLESIRNFYESQSNRALRQAEMGIIEGAVAHNRQVAFFIPPRAVAGEARSLSPGLTLRSLGEVTLTWSDRFWGRAARTDSWELCEVVRPAAPEAATAR